MEHCILRTKKIKTRANLTAAGKHNYRIKYQYNFSNDRKNDNEMIYDNLGIDPKDGSSLQKKLTTKYEDLGIKEKEGNVLAMEFVVAASPSYFFKDIPGWTQELWDSLKMTNPVDKVVIDGFWLKADKKRIDDYFEAQLEFFKNEFGDAVENMVVHKDEKSPHAHIIVNTAIKSVKTYKNRYGTTSKETVSLNAKRFSRGFLTVLHTKHAEWNSKFGLSRGKENSKARHQALSEYYDKGASEIIKLLEELSNHKQVELLMKKKLPQIIKKMNAYADSVEILLSVLDNKDLTPQEVKVIETICKIVEDDDKSNKNSLKI